MKPVSRKAGTLRNMVFEYAMMALMIVRGIVLPPLAARYIDHNLLGAWFASGNIMQWLMVSEGGAWLFLRQRAAVEFGRGDHTALAAGIGSSGIIIVSLGTVTVLLSLSIAPLVPGWLHVDARLSGELVMAFSLTAMGMGLGFLASIPRAVGHGLQRQVAVNTSLLVAESTSLAASIVLLMNGYGLLSLGVGLQTVARVGVLFALVPRLAKHSTEHADHGVIGHSVSVAGMAAHLEDVGA